MSRPRLFVAEDVAWLGEAVRKGGGEVVAPGEAQAAVWGFGEPAELNRLLLQHPALRWVQLCSAGIERYADLLSDGRTWTSAKGVFSRAVAEHALALLLAGLREIPARARARAWGPKGGRSLFGSRLTLIGAGGITQELIHLLQPFAPEIVVVRRRPTPLPGAARTVDADHLDQAITGRDAVVLAPALTGATRGLVGAEQLRLMGAECWLVNVGRGQLVDTPALVSALRKGEIAGAALDVTEPEPLPTGHPLWALSNCLVTPHTANPPELERRGLLERVAANVHSFALGEPLIGGVEPAIGY